LKELELCILSDQRQSSETI